MRILVAESDLAARAMLEDKIAEWGFDVVTCEDGAQAWRALRGDDSPKMAVLDLDLPNMDGLQICRVVRELKKRPHIYLIITISPNRRAEIETTLEAGVDDFIIKPIDPLDLQTKIRAGSRIIRLQGTVTSFLDHYEAQAVSDPLTGLWNESAIVDILGRELARSVRQSTSIGFLVAKLDQFDELGDPSGRLTGDGLIREVARRIYSSVRSYDSVGLTKGKSFVIVAPGCDASNVQTLAKRLNASVGCFRAEVAGDSRQLTMSLGVVLVDSKEDWDPASILRAGEQALASAKNKAGDRIEIWNEQIGRQ